MPRGSGYRGALSWNRPGDGAGLAGSHSLIRWMALTVAELAPEPVIRGAFRTRGLLRKQNAVKIDDAGPPDTEADHPLKIAIGVGRVTPARVP